MLRKLLSTIVCILFVSGAVFAQGTITGTVTDGQSGETLPGVNIQLPELNRGAATDAEGQFTLNNVPPGTHTLQATFIGYRSYSQDVTVVSGEEVTVNIELQADVVGLEDVVVTAQGIQREQRSLGYSVSEVSSESFEASTQTDVSRILSGKVSGVNITNSSGVSGSPTDFVIRGYTTLTGSNQPLFIVDGVAFNSSTNTGGEDFTEGGNLTSPSRFLDIDPSNVKSVSVLKGLSATTIYGEQGKNGVVVIETKSGSFGQDREAGFSVDIRQSYYQNKIASLPDYQDNYGGGFHQNFGYFFSNWGPNFESQFLENVSGFQGFDEQGFATFPHPYSQFSDPALLAAFPEFQGTAFSYKPYDSVDRFFNTGNVMNTSFRVSGGTEDLNVNLSVARSDEEGFTPGNTLIKNNVGLGLNFEAFENLRFRATANMALTDMETPPVAASYGSSADTGGGGSIFGDVIYTPRSIDLMGLPWENPVDNSSVYYRSGNDIQNPRWTARNIKRTSNVDRLYGKTEVIWDVIDEISINYKLGLDTYIERQKYLRNKGGVNNPDLTGGYMHSRSVEEETWNHNLLVNFDKDLTDEINLNGLVGSSVTVQKFQSDGLGSTNQIIFDLFEHPNFTSPSATNGLSGSQFQFQQREETAGIFYDITAGYNDYVYLNLSGRNDWFSTLETENRSIFYPSVSLSVIPTEAFDIRNDILSYLKVRGGIGTSAEAPSPYNTRSSLGTSARAFLDASGAVVTTNATSNTLGNPNLKAAKHIEYEVGIESKFVQSRIGLDVTVYQRFTDDLITRANLDPATGYTNTLVNIGEIENRGLEIGLRGTPVQGEFTWNTTWNFFSYVSEVNDLGQDLDEIAIAGFTNLGNFAIEGEPLNVMKGTVIKRDDQGRRLVNENGDYIEADDLGIIGDPNPDYTLSAINTFRYKNFSLNVQVDYKHGGDIYSTTVRTLLARGISTDTDFDRQRPVILPGYKENGEPNDIQISATQAFFPNIGFGPDEVSVFDGTTIRLNEVSLSYQVPNTLLDRLPLKGASVTLSGYNLWYFTPNIPEGSNFDPNVAGTGADNGLGFEYLNGPSSRRIGGSISLQF